MTNSKEQYRLSFTAASTMLPGFVRLAAMAVENAYDLDRLSNDQIGKEKESSNIRQFRELKHRLGSLTREQITLLAEGSLPDQKHISLLAFCKTYRFIADFVVQVVRDKALVYDYEIRESDYNSFLNREAFNHPELEELTESSQTKIKTVLFRMLAEVGLIDNAKTRLIQPVLLSREVERAVVEDDPDWLKIYLKSDKEIEQIKNDN